MASDPTTPAAVLAAYAEHEDRIAALAAIDVQALPPKLLGQVSKAAKALHVAAEVEVARRAADRLAKLAALEGAAETGLAAKLRWIAEGRRAYLHGAPEDARRLIELQVSTIEQMAQVVDGDLEPLYGLLPSYLWTDAMDAALRDEKPEPGQATREAGRG